MKLEVIQETGLPGEKNELERLLKEAKEILKITSKARNSTSG